MRIKCLHGYFKIWETRAGDVSRFASYFGLSLVQKDDYYTFTALSEAPDYVFAGTEYLGAAAAVTFEGRPWQIMRENSLVYNFNTGLVQNIQTIATAVELGRAGNYYFSSGLLLPGSVKEDGSRVTEYSAWYLWDSLKFKYSEVVFEAA